MKIGIVYDVVNLSTGECVKGGSTTQKLSERWAQKHYLNGKGKYSGYGLIEAFRIGQQANEPDDLFRWHLYVKEQQHILQSGYKESKHPLRNIQLPLNGVPDAGSLASLGGFRTQELYPNLSKENGRKGGRKNVESGHLTKISASGGRVAGRISGPIQGRKNVESGLLARARLLCIGVGGRTNAKSGHCARISGLGVHANHHVKPGILKLGCKYCDLLRVPK